MENRLTIVAKDGLVGGAHVVLCDETASTFQTNLLSEFARVVNPAEHQVFAAASGIVTAWPKAVSNTTVPVAECSAQPSPWLTGIHKAIARGMVDEDGCEDFLKRYRAFLCNDGLMFLANVRNLTVQKVVNYVRQKDTKGNFSYQYTVEDGQKAAFVPPDRITLTIPMFLGHPDKVQIGLDVDFSFNQSTGSTPKANAGFRFECVGLDDLLLDAGTSIVRGYLADLDSVTRWGGLSVSRKTDEWKYRDAPVRIVEGDAANGGKADGEYLGKIRR